VPHVAAHLAHFLLSVLLTQAQIICRYISEDHDGVVLHPIDVLDVGTGAVMRSMIDPNLQLINPVNMPHPLLTGSSGNLYCWRPEVRNGCIVLCGVHIR
jgi:hypothetical protein